MSEVIKLKKWEVHSSASPYLEATGIRKFIQWTEDQQFNRMLWLAVAFFVQAGVLAPVAIMATLTSSSSFLLIIGAMASILAVVVTNLAALPTKITIPVFFASVLLDLGIIGYCLVSAIA